MRPAHQGFHADDAARSQVDLRLVMQNDLAAVLCPAQVIRQIQIQHYAHLCRLQCPGAHGGRSWTACRHQHSRLRTLCGYLSVRSSSDERFGGICGHDGIIRLHRWQPLDTRVTAKP